MKPQVSILICCYNSGDYIISTLKSVLEQTFENFEILILDNGSSDQTLKNLKSFFDTRIKIFEAKKNLGPYGGLNFLLSQADGEYIAIQDHDDIWHPEKLQKQIEFLEKNPEFVGCGTKCCMFYENDEKYFLYYLGEKNFYTIHPSLVFRNQKNLKYDENLSYFGDAYFQKFQLCHGKKLIYNLPQVLTLHLIKDGYGNYTFSRFKFSKSYFKRIFDIHGKSFYSFFALGYEISKKIVLVPIRKFNLYKIYKIFDTLPYKASGNKFFSIKNTKNKDILTLYKLLKS